MKSHRTLIRLGLVVPLLLAFAILLSIPGITTAQGPSRPIPTTRPIPNGIYAAMVQAIQNRPARILPGKSLVITSLDQSSGWAISTVALKPDKPDEGDSILAHSTLVLARRANSQWAAAIMGTQAYENLLTSAPASLLSARAKRFLRSPNLSTPNSPEGISTSLKWPWQNGQTWMFTQGRHDTNNAAVDLAPYYSIPENQRAVVAAAGGVVIRRCEDDIQSMIAIRHTTGAANDNITGYLHLDKTTVSLPTGTIVSQGDTLGITYNKDIPQDPNRCGYSTGPHVHLMTGTIPAASNNGGQITLMDFAGTVLSGWTLNSDDCFHNAAESRCVGKNFVSDNVGTPPTTPSAPDPADGTTLSRTNDTTWRWTTTGLTCDYHIWGGSLDLTPPSGSCSSFHFGLQKGGSFQWQVTAHKNGATVPGPVWHFNIRPSEPVSVTASATSPTQVNLAWTKSADDPGDVDSYKVYKNGGQLVTTLPSGTTSYTATGLTCGSTYSFYVTSVRQGVESVASNTASAALVCPCYTLSPNTSPSAGGSITANPAPNCKSGTQYTSGTAVTLSATPVSGYAFSAWSGDVSGSTNSISLTITANKTVTATFVALAKPLVNGNFESGRNVGWSESSSAGYPIVDTKRPHAGSYSAYFCDYNSCTEYIQQQLTVPTGSPTLSYWWFMTTSDSTVTANDYLRVRLYSTTGTLLATLQTRSNTSTRNAWVQDSLDLTAYAGQTVILRFIETTNASLPTAFYVDDVVMSSSAPPPPPPTCYTLSPNTSPSAGGSITANPAPNCKNGTQYTSGTAVTLSATPASGYAFSAWSGDASGSTNPISLTITANKTVTATFAALAKPLVNGNFESGRNVGWSEYSVAGYPIVDTKRPHAGSYSAYFCDYNACTEYIQQQLTVPTGSPTLSYWWFMTSSEGTTTPYDYFKVQLYSTSGTLLSTLQTRSNTATRNAWVKDTVNLSSYAGQKLILRFITTTDASAPSAFYVDDVTVQ